MLTPHTFIISISCIILVSESSRLLVEAANGYSRVRAGRKSADLEQRQQGNPPEVIAYAAKASDRLRRKYMRISIRSKGNIVNTAVAPELNPIEHFWVCLKRQLRKILP